MFVRRWLNSGKSLHNREEKTPLFWVIFYLFIYLFFYFFIFCILNIVIGKN